MSLKNGEILFPVLSLLTNQAEDIKKLSVHTVGLAL